MTGVAGGESVGRVRAGADTVAAVRTVSQLVRRPSWPEPRILDGVDAVARVRPWAGDPGTVSLITVDRADPSADTISEWLRELAGDGVRVVRTGALGPTAQGGFRETGFHVAQELSLLTHDLRSLPSASSRVDPPRIRRLVAAARLIEVARVDQRAFEAPWGLDVVGVIDSCRATPRFRLRVVEIQGVVAAYAITGLAAGNAYLQRLAVDPTAQGMGLGRALTIDALRWAQGRRCRSMLVNTHTGNATALSLYRSVGFTDLQYRLVVMERRIG